MIKRLRKKFILTNMLLVALVLIIVFGALVGYNYQRLVRQSEEAMRTALKWSDDAPPPVFQFGASHEEEMEEQGEERRFTMVPVFVVLLDEDGGPAQVTGGNNVEVSDQVVAQAVAAATEESGAISGLNLRYLQDTDREGNSRIAFADMGWETDSLWPLIRSSLLVGALALGGFFVISLMLSGLALKPAEEAWEQQRRFVADASHELKTPLTVILTNTGILLAHSGDTIAQQQKWVEYIGDEAQRMRALVEDLLFLAKSDAGKETAPVTAPVDVSELTWSALLPFEPVAFEQGVEMESEIADQLTVQGNADQLRRLVAILLDNAVKYATNAGMYVIIDWHILSDGNPQQNQKEALKFFKKMAKKYKNNTNVIYEICNEPNGGTSWSTIKKYAEKIIKGIRTYDKKAVILVGTPNWSQDVDQAALSPVSKKYRKNVMYTLHFYAATHKEWLRDKAQAALDKGLPLFVSEFSICDASGNGGLDKAEAKKWLTFLDKNNISYMAWSLSNKAESSAFIKSGCSNTGKWYSKNLTAAGKWITNWYKKK